MLSIESYENKSFLDKASQIVNEFIKDSEGALEKLKDRTALELINNNKNLKIKI